MKWMLAVIMSVAMVSPALASVDVTLAAADGTNLIVLPAGTTTATVQLAVGLGKPTNAAGTAQPVASMDFGLKLADASVGNGTFTITGRASDGTILGVAGCIQNSLYTDPDTFESYDTLLVAPGNSFSKTKVSGDLGWTAGTSWQATKFPGVIDTITVELNGLQNMDNYIVTLGDPGAGLIVVNPAGAQFPIGALGSVTISVLPEPASLLLLALGGLFLRRRHA